MSHFITATQFFQPSLIKTESKKIIERNNSRLLNSIITSKPSSIYKNANQENYMKICNKFIKKEYDKVKQKQETNSQKQNNNLMTKEYCAYKRNWKKSINNQNSQLLLHKRVKTQIQRFFDNGDEKIISLKQFYKQLPSTIQILKKYSRKAAISFAKVHEACQISTSKQKYRNWYNETYNNVKKSKIYMQMNKTIKFSQSLHKRKKSDFKPNFQKIGLISKNYPSLYHKKSQEHSFQLRSSNLDGVIKRLKNIQDRYQNISSI